MAIKWNGEFIDGQLVAVLIGAVGVATLLLPGLMLLHSAALAKGRLAEAAPKMIALAAVLSIAWCGCIYSLTFAPPLNFDPPPEAAKISSSFSELRESVSNTTDTTMAMGRGGWIGNFDYAFFRRLTPEGSPSEPLFPSRRPHYHVPQTEFMMFQMMLFLTAGLVVAVPLANWISTGALLIFLVAWGAFVYAPIAHWMWGDGWLNMRGAVDSGGGLLHVLIGFSALGCALIWPNPVESAQNDSAEGLVNQSRGGPASLGAALVWAGALLLHASFGMKWSGATGAILLNTHLAAACGAGAWAGTAALLGKRLERTAPAYGVISGLACAAAGCSVLNTPAAMIVGVLGGLSGFVASESLRSAAIRRPGLLIWAIQGVPGGLGLLLAGVFAAASMGVTHWNGQHVSGLVEGDWAQLEVQALALAVSAALACGGTALLAGLVRLAGPRPRVSPAV